MKVKIQDSFHNWKNESVYDPLMIEYTKKRAENLGQRPEDHPLALNVAAGG